MAKDGAPQIEDGYTRIANELLEAFCKLKCRNEESRLLMAVIRLTYGIYGRKSARIENRVLQEMTAMPYWQLWRARDLLIKRNIISCSTGANQKVITYSINKYYRKWKSIAPAPKHSTGAIDSTDAIKHSTDAIKHSTGANPTFIKESIKENLKETGGEKDPPPDPPPEKKKKYPPPPYQKIIEYFNKLTGSNFDHTAKETRASIRARFKSGFTEQDFYDVIMVKTDQWIGDPKMIAYLRPGTLFRPTKFEGYLMEAKRRKDITISENQKAKEDGFRIAAGILRESGQEACLAYCNDHRINGEEFKAWILKNTSSQ